MSRISQFLKLQEKQARAFFSSVSAKYIEITKRLKKISGSQDQAQNYRDSKTIENLKSDIRRHKNISFSGSGKTSRKAKKAYISPIINDPNAAKVEVEFNFTSISRGHDLIFSQHTGLFGQQMMALMVAKAKRLCPPGMRSFIHVYVMEESEERYHAFLLCNHPWANAVENGTGLYGPNHTPIVPKKAKMLHWVNKYGQDVYATSVKGQEPQFFLRRAKEYVMGRVNKLSDQFAKKMESQKTAGMTWREEQRALAMMKSKAYKFFEEEDPMSEADNMAVDPAYNTYYSGGR